MMALSNYERMILLADEVFSSRTDPHQLNVNENVMEHLQLIHSDTISEYDDGNGPVCWILCIPTTLDLMNKFINKTKNKKGNTGYSLKKRMIIKRLLGKRKKNLIIKEKNHLINQSRVTIVKTHGIIEEFLKVKKDLTSIHDY